MEHPDRKTISYRFIPTLRQRIALLFSRAWELKMEFSPESNFMMYKATFTPYAKEVATDGN